VLLMGVDCGSTAIKAAIFDETGIALAAASRRVAAIRPAPGHVEQDMTQLWLSAAAAMREAIERCGVPVKQIGCVGVTAHGDGLYLADRFAAPLGNAIQSVDSRGFEITQDWRLAGYLDRAEELTAQRPYPYAATTLLAWIKRHRPEQYGAIGHVMFCKDWLRYCLTGVFATDPTDASTAFTNPRTQTYDPLILKLFDLQEVETALAPIRPICGEIGAVTKQASALTGLVEGTPVSGGLHDVTASAVGLGNLESGALSVTAGTFSINETLSSTLVVDPRWAARAGLRLGQWMNMAISPASSNNVEWFLRQAYRPELAQAERLGVSVWSLIDSDLSGDSGVDDPLFHPFLYGSPYDEPASAGFFGLRSWHDRAHMLRAVIEGAVFNHRTHALALASAFPLRRAGIAGGGSSTPRLAQLFADVLGMPVEIPEAKEVGALGAAIAAGVGVGAFATLEDGVAQVCRVAARYECDASRHAALCERYERYAALVECLRGFWLANSGRAIRRPTMDAPIPGPLS
jgi:L-xylulokinase